MKKGPTTTDSYPYCLCGCDAKNKPKRRFKQGHDGRLLGVLIRVEKGKLSADDIPDVLIEAARSNRELKVVGYTAQDILRLAGHKEDGEN